MIMWLQVLFLCNLSFVSSNEILYPIKDTIYFMNGTDNRVWTILFPHYTVSCGYEMIPYILSRTAMEIRFGPHLELHKQTVYCSLWLGFQNRDRRTFTFMAYDFAAVFHPTNRSLLFHLNHEISCTPWPQDNRVNYSDIRLDYHGDVQNQRVNKTSIKFFNDRNLYGKQLCLKCSCGNYFEDAVCYTYVGFLPFNYTHQHIYAVYIQDYPFEAFFYSPEHDNHIYETWCKVFSPKIKTVRITFNRNTVINNGYVTGNNTFICYTKNLVKQVNMTIYPFIMNEKPLTIMPEEFDLNYSFYGLITCSLVPQLSDYQHEIVIKGANMSASDYSVLSGSIIEISLKPYLNRKVYCFTCFISMTNLTQCYYLLGFYKLQFEPQTDIIYFVTEIIVCNAFLRGVVKDHGDIVLPNEYRSYYTIDSKGNVAFKNDMNLHGRYICLKCSLLDEKTTRCYTFLAFILLQYEPLEELYNVYYIEFLLHFNFISNTSREKFDALCYISKGVPWTTTTASTFKLVKKIPANNYTFNCTMVNYNYSIDTTLTIINHIENATITPNQGIIYYMDDITIKCVAQERYFGKYLVLSVRPKDIQYIIKISIGEYGFKKELFVRNNKICAFCKVHNTLFDSACYLLKFHIGFTYTPYRGTYYLFRHDYYIYPRFYNEIVNKNITTKCQCNNCPRDIVQIEDIVRIGTTAPDGVYTMICVYPNNIVKQKFDIIISHHRVVLTILPDTNIIYTSQENDIKCSYDVTLKLNDSDFDFMTDYSDKKAYSKVSPVIIRLVRALKYYNSSICFACNLDRSASTTRCYNWMGYIKFHRNPTYDIYFIYYIVNVETYFINLNDTLMHIPAECHTVTGPSPLVQSPDRLNIIITSMQYGKYLILCKMQSINHYVYFNMSIQSPGRPLFKSSLFPDKFNASHTTLLPGEEITFTLFYADRFYGVTYEWSHYKETTWATKTKEERLEKNKALIIEGNLLIIDKNNIKRGFDYSMYCASHFKAHVITALVNYTIVGVPSKISVNSSFYVMSHDFIHYDSDGFPPELVLYRLSLRNLIICDFSTEKMCKVPATSHFGLAPVNISITNELGNMAVYTSWRLVLVSIRAFEAFQWLNSSKIIFYQNDVLMCASNLSLSFVMNIIQLSGATHIDDTAPRNKITMTDLLPGKYKLACILYLQSYGYKFIRVKSFEIYSKSNRLCFLPFAPSMGMVIKCVADHYPIIGVFKMTLAEKGNKFNILINKNDFLKIPYIISMKRVYEITCHYNTHEKELNVSKEFILKNSHRVILYQEEIPCQTTERPPQEYDYHIANKDTYYTYNQLFYLDDVFTAIYIYTIFILLSTFLFQFLVIPVQIMYRKKSKTEQNTLIILQNEYLMKRQMIRKLNEKSMLSVNLQMLGIGPKDFNMLGAKQFMNISSYNNV